jgi:hypothetical protein
MVLPAARWSRCRPQAPVLRCSRPMASTCNRRIGASFTARRPVCSDGCSVNASATAGSSARTWETGGSGTLPPRWTARSHSPHASAAASSRLGQAAGDLAHARGNQNGRSMGAGDAQQQRRAPVDRHVENLIGLIHRAKRHDRHREAHQGEAIRPLPALHGGRPPSTRRATARGRHRRRASTARSSRSA